MLRGEGKLPPSDNTQHACVYRQFGMLSPVEYNYLLLIPWLFCPCPKPVWKDFVNCNLQQTVYLHDSYTHTRCHFPLSAMIKQYRNDYTLLEMSTNTSSTLAAIQQCLVACQSRGKRSACSLTEDQCTRRVHCQWWGSSTQTIFSTANAHLLKEFLSENWSQSKVVGWDWTLWDCFKWHVTSISYQDALEKTMTAVTWTKLWIAWYYFVTTPAHDTVQQW